MRFLAAALLLAISGLSQFAQARETNATTRYYVVFLRPNPARVPLAKSDAERIQSSHMANIRKMADDGVLVSAGPFDDEPTTISGIFIFTVDSMDNAKAIAGRDPTVVAFRNTVDVHAWEGPPGIGIEYFRLHKADPKTPENMQVHPFCMLYRGAAWGKDPKVREEQLAAHSRYLEQLKYRGKLGAAGPIDAPDDLFGLVIFRALPLEEAEKILDDDPAVKAQVLRVEYHHWWSSDHVMPW